MLKNAVALKGALFAGVLSFGLVLTGAVAPAQATTLFNVGGSFGGVIVPQNPNNETDVFSANLNGTLSFNEAAHQATLSFTFNGALLDSATGPQIGSLNGQVTYIYENVHSVSLSGNDYILSLTPNGVGDGVGAFGNVTLTANGVTDSVVFDLDAGALKPNGSEPWFNDYNPVSTYLLNNNQGAYLILGQLSGFSNAVKGWFSSKVFDMWLGAGRDGHFTIHADLHGSFTPTGGTEIPEPASLALLGVGLLGAAARRRQTR